MVKILGGSMGAPNCQISKLIPKMNSAPSKTHISIYNMYFGGIPNFRGSVGGPLIVEFQNWYRIWIQHHRKPIYRHSHRLCSSNTRYCKSGGEGGDRGPQNTKFEKSPKTRLGNCIRKVHAKFGQASSIRNDRKVGGTKSLNNQKIHFWLQNGHF